MFIIKLLRLLRGYVTVRIKGGFAERFLNLAVRKNIDFWNVVREDGYLTLCIRKKDFKRLRDIAKKSSCRITIQRKIGIPFMMFRYRRRTALFVGFGLFLTALWVLSLFLWSVEVVADEGIDKNQVIQSLSSHGIKSGTRLATIRSDEIKNSMMIEFENIAFIGINIKGTKAVVEIKKRDMAPVIIPLDQPCNIVAAKTGQIIKMETKEGIAQVKTGQGVHQGQLLVSGIVDSQVIGARYVHAMAQITAKTWYRHEATGYMVKTVRERTGNQTSRFRLKIFDLPINLYLNSGNPYEYYDKMVYDTQVSITKKIVLPIVLEQDRFLEMVEIKTEQTKDEAILEAQTLCDEAFSKENADAAVVGRIPVVEELGDHVRVVIDYECEENIVKEETIQLSLEEARVWQSRQLLLKE